MSPSIQLTFLYGDAPLLIERATAQLIDALLPEAEQTYGVVTLDLATAEASHVAEAIGTGSLMAEKRVVVLRNAEAFKAKAPKTGGKGKASAPKAAADEEGEEAEKKGAGAQNRLAELLANLPPGVSAILAFNAEARALKKDLPVSARLGKLIKEKGQAQAFRTPSEDELAGWVVKEAGQLGKGIDAGAAQQLVAVVGRDHARLLVELQKLALYVGDAPAITAQDVAQAASRSAEASVFELVDAIAEGDAQKALSALPDLLPAHSAQSAAIPLLGMMARQFRLIWQAAYLAQRGVPVDRGGPLAPEVAALFPTQHHVDEARRFDFVARKLARHARSLGDRDVAQALARILYADRALKGQTREQLDPRLIMERLVIELCLLARRANQRRAR